MEFVSSEYQQQLDRLADTLCPTGQLSESTDLPPDVTYREPTVFTAGRLTCPGALAELTVEWEREAVYRASICPDIAGRDIRG